MSDAYVPTGEMLTQAEVTSRLCKLMADVTDKLVGWDHPCDCICRPSNVAGYRNDGAALAFIEKAVRVALEKGFKL